MKPTREEIELLAQQIGCGSYPNSNGVFRPPLNIEAFFLAAYRMGQEEVRKWLIDKGYISLNYTEDVLSLPLEGDEE